MYKDETVKSGGLPHLVTLEGRERMTVTGVEDVEGFDENSVSIYTSEGLLTVAGEELHIEKLNLDNGELSLYGRVDSMEYSEGGGEKTGFFTRLFG